jgi:cell division protein FtsZ
VTYEDAFRASNDVLNGAVAGIAEVINCPGMVNVDFADVRTVMQSGGSALMGTGIGRGENRATEAAQQAISSPLLDNVSISGATGVLVNITGGTDLTLGEVHQINEIVHDAVGDDAEIIFGAVNEPAMQGEIRVTVIATGFDRIVTNGATSTSDGQKSSATPVIPFPAQRPMRTVIPQSRSASNEGSRRIVQPPHGTNPLSPQEKAQDLNDMEIPTFIRRQMD